MKKNECKFDYYPLRGFIYSNREIKNCLGLAKFLGITSKRMDDILHNHSSFSQAEILKIIKYFNLTPEQVVEYFFTEENEDYEPYRRNKMDEQ